MTLETFPWDAALFLKSEEEIAGYLSNMMADDDAETTRHALGVAVRAAGMMKVCEKTGLTRQGINKATREGSRPQFDTVARIAKGLGLKIQFVPQGMTVQFVPETCAA